MSDLDPLAVPAPAGLPPGAQPRYRPQEWASLVNACRQPSRYRFGLLLPGEFEEPFPAGEGARWFRLPAGLLLLAPSSAGRWSSCVDLAAVPLYLGPFVLRWLPPVTEKTEKRREKLRQVRQERRELRGTRVPGVAAIPNEGRAVRKGGRLSLAVSGRFVKQRRAEVERMAKRQATHREKRGGDLFRPALVFIENLNSMTRELEEVAAFTWVEVETLRAWDATTRGAALRALVSRGMKAAAARQLVGTRVRTWQRSRPSQARQQEQVKEQEQRPTPLLALIRSQRRGD